jgi:hypothetical protein
MRNLQKLMTEGMFELVEHVFSALPRRNGVIKGYINTILGRNISKLDSTCSLFRQFKITEDMPKNRKNEIIGYLTPDKGLTFISFYNAYNR